MIVRLFQTGNFELETVGDMLWRADSQANFHPDSRWIDSSSYGTEEQTGRTYREFYLRWIGREPVVMWLMSNQILFEVTSYAMLPEEEEAIAHSYSDENKTDAPLN